MIGEIQAEIIWNGRNGGVSWFHPRATRLPDGSVLMTCQPITESDVYGQVHWCKTVDNGHSWSTQQPIAAMARHDIAGGLQEGICDVVPEYHAATGAVLAMGHNVYYKNDVLTRATQGRYSVYVVGDGNGNWSERKRLVWDNPRATGVYSCGCAQRLTYENGDVLIPLYFVSEKRKDFSVTTVRAKFDGETMNIIAVGNELRLAVNRGLLEPSVTHFGERYYMTIRAEDGHGYLSVSSDGLDWNAEKVWMFDDDEALIMSTTQQHWLTHSDGLFLVYTRKTPENLGVFRWRAPLFVAQVDVETNRLIRATERIVLPIRGNGLVDGDGARMGNFHVTNVTPDESWVTVGEARPNDGWRGDTLLSRIRWDTPNTLVGAG